MRQTGFQHEVLFYGDADEFLAGAVPFLRDTLESGGAALVAVSQERSESLRGELGEDADGVRFAPMEELGRNPARIIPFWRDFLDEHGGRDRPVCGVGEPVWRGRTAAELEECRRHEQLLNVAFAAAPSWSLLCPYDSSSLGEDVLQSVKRCHPLLARGGLSEANTAYSEVEPGSVGPFAGALPPPPRSAERLEFDRYGLHEVRARVAAAAEHAGLSFSGTADLVTVASELATNSVMHGGGEGAVDIWRDAGAIFVEVADAGTIDEPLVGRRRPSPTQARGRGIWIANLLCDLVQIRSGATGTIVRLQMGRGR